jgi:hypothetical protein
MLGALDLLVARGRDDLRVVRLPMRESLTGLSALGDS